MRALKRHLTLIIYRRGNVIPSKVTSLDKGHATISELGIVSYLDYPCEDNFKYKVRIVDMRPYPIEVVS